MDPIKAGEDITESQASFKSKRDQYSIEIRKKKTEDVLNSKRLKFSRTGEGEQVQEKINAMELQELKAYFKQYVDEFFSSIKADDTEKLYNALNGIRRIISRNSGDSLNTLLYDAKILPTIATLLDEKFKDYSKVQFEAAWIITNLAGGEPSDTNYCVNTLHAIERFIKILNRPVPLDPNQVDNFENLRDQAVWALCNLSGDSDVNRDKCLQYDLMDNVLAILSGASIRPTHLRNFLWLVSNLCRGKPYPPFDEVSSCLPFLAQIVRDFKDTESLSYAFWALSSLSTNGEYQIQTVYQALDPKMIIKYSTEENPPQIRVPVWRLIGNLLSGKSSIAEELLQNGLGWQLYCNLQSKQKVLRIETLWSISNIIANGPPLIQLILDVKEMVSRIFYMVENDDFRVKKEALHCLSNITSCGSFQQIQFLAEHDIIAVLIRLLGTESEAEFVCLILEALTNILDAGQERVSQGGKCNKFLLQLEEVGGVKIIEKLQQHPHQDVYSAVYNIIDKFFLVDGN